MKLNKIALALVAAAATPMVANAGVTVSPLLLGYHYSDIKDTAEKQRDILRSGKDLYADAENHHIAGETRGTTGDKGSNGGVAQKSGLYTGAALGIELTPSTQFQIEYGVSNTDGEASKASAEFPVNRFDVEQEMISGNFLIGTEQFTGATDSKFKPYVLVGAGQSKIKVENQEAYSTSQRYVSGSQAGEKTGYSFVPTDVSPDQLEDYGYNLPAGTKVASTKDTIGNLGIGAMYRVNDALSLRGEARAIHNFDNNWWEGMALAGLEVVLGGHLSPNAPTPPDIEEVEPVEEEVVEFVPETEVVDVAIDSDGDGVPDNLDACPNTPLNVVVDERGCPKQVDIQDDLKMELRIFFDNDKSNIKPQFKPEIAKVAEKMREYPNATANIQGFASKTGPSFAYNMRLSQARAMAVKSMLANEYGIQPNRMTTEGFGYTRPIAPNNTPEGRALNRRVYAIITGNKTVQVDQTKDMVNQ